MGLPIWKPRFTDEELEELEKKEKIARALQRRRIITHQLLHSSSNNNNNNNNNSNSNIINNNNNSIPIASSSTINFGPLRRPRSGRRQSMLTSSLMDRRQSTSRLHPHSRHYENSTGAPVRSELDRRLQQRIKEKEDVLEQLQVTVSLLDQFISARVALGSSATALPAFITRDLPAILQSATISVGLAPQPNNTESSTTNNNNNNNNNNTTTIQEMVDRLLQIPPYSAQVYTVENNIISAYRRIREQLGLLDSSVIIPSPPLSHRSPPSSSSSTTAFTSSLTSARTTAFSIPENDLSQI